MNKEQLKDLLQHTFQVMLVTYLLLLLIENIRQGLVSNYMNLNYLLILVIVLGVLNLLFVKPQERPKEKITRKDYIYISLLSIAGIIIIFYKTKQLRYLSYIISIVAGILIFLLSYLVLTEEEDEQN